MAWPISLSSRNVRRKAAHFGALVAVVLAGLWLADRLMPLPPPDQARFASVIVARDGAPLRAFADDNGIWRYPVTLDQVSPNYIDALLSYEDRWFYHHPGVNPLSLMRATWQNAVNGTVISGGSTITMQVARLIDPVERTLPGKLKQIARALQLEWHYSKDEILTLYLNRAPFGGPVEGVQAAAYTYFGKSAASLSDAEAALLAVLPQAPSRNRPDRHPNRAKAMRDKVLKRLVDEDVWLRSRVDDALAEPVWAQFYRQPIHAPLLSRRLNAEHPEQILFHTNIDTNLQQGIADLIRNRIQGLPPGTSAAVLVMENRSLAVRAYVGSADFTDEERFGHVDMVTALRSPGSTLKPFIYGMALDQGLIHSQSLLVDAPSDFGDYRPENFDKGFRGPVSVTDALQRSLNVPAVEVLDKVGENRFMSRLKNSGMEVVLPSGAAANLALGLGGAGTTLESLVGAYSALANNGLAGRPRLLMEEPLWQRPVLSEGASWIIRNILATAPRSDRPVPYLVNYGGNSLAWKTGTSYGFRDSWAVGTTEDYTVGVWVGRPDGTPLPGYYGAVAAAPLLFAITDHLPPAEHPERYQVEPPANVSKEVICWPLGRRDAETPSDQCHRRLEAYLLDGNTPMTFADDEWSANPLVFTVNADTGKRVDAGCKAARTEVHKVALWPSAVEAWVRPKYRRYHQIPPYDDSCSNPPAIDSGAIRIAGIHDGSTISPAGADHHLPDVRFQALGGQGSQYWFINGALAYRLAAGTSHLHHFDQPGEYVVTVVDEQGRSDEVKIDVRRN